MKLENWLAFAGGMVIGGVVLMMIAPKSRREMCTDIKKKMEDAKLAILFGAGQTVFNVAAFLMSSILLVNATNNPFIYWQF